ncbi:hypothetical protein SSTU70S_04045 [Stutzerimonas stutzeri]
MDGDNRQPQPAQLVEPALQQAAADGDDPVATVVQHLAEAQVQLVDVLRQQLLGGVGQRLLQPARLARRQRHGEGAAVLGRQHQRDRALRGSRALRQAQPAAGAFARQPVTKRLRLQVRATVGGQEQAIHDLAFSLCG